MEKVVFVGNYEPYLPQNTIEGTSITISFFNIADWRNPVYTGDLITLFEGLGCDLHTGATDPANIERAADLAKEMPSYPAQGYIFKDKDGLVIIKISESE